MSQYAHGFLWPDDHHESSMHFGSLPSLTVLLECHKRILHQLFCPPLTYIFFFISITITIIYTLHFIHRNIYIEYRYIMCFFFLFNRLSNRRKNKQSKYIQHNKMKNFVKFIKYELISPILQLFFCSFHFHPLRSAFFCNDKSIY